MGHESHNQRFPQSDGSGSRIIENNSNRTKYTGQSENQEDNEEEFPGYPHYPASEDIMNPSNRAERVPVDVEKLTPSGGLINQAAPKEPVSPLEESVFQPATNTTEDEIRIVPGTEADVTKEDLSILNATDGVYAPASATVTGEDLDIPGADLDDVNEDIGEEDEENNYYSL